MVLKINGERCKKVIDSMMSKQSKENIYKRIGLPQLHPGIYKMYVLLIALLIFQIIDVYTTYCLISLGAEEANVVVLFLMKYFGDIIGLTILKLFAMVLLFLSVPMMWHRRWVRFSLYSVNAIYFIVCAINLYVLLS